MADMNFGEPSGGGFVESHFDFSRCQRPDGSFYGTGGQCRKGAPVGAKEKETKSSGSGGGGGDTKQLRKDMIAARDAEKTAKEARRKAETELKSQRQQLADAKTKEGSAKPGSDAKETAGMYR